MSGLGAGKTFSGCIKAVLKANEGQDGLIIAPTYTMLRDATEKTLFSILDDGNQHYEFNKTEGVLKYHGAQILFRSADMPDRARGTNLNWAYLDEASQMHESMWQIVLGRLRQGKNPQAWITTTPAGFNWVYRYWVEKTDPNYELIHSTTHENVYLPEEYVRDLESNYVGEFAKQEIGGDFVLFEGLVYNEFSMATHVFTPTDIPEDWMRVQGVDFGFTNPFVCLWGAVDGDGRLYIYREHYQAKTLIKDHAAVIKDEVAWAVADHDAQDAAELASLGVQTIPADKGSGSVIGGLQKVKARMKVLADGYPRLFISKACPNLIREMMSYRWPGSKQDRNEKEEPVKENDHALDALRYIVARLDKGKSGSAGVSAGALGL